MYTPPYKTLIRCYDLLTEMKEDCPTAPIYMLRVDIERTLEQAMEAPEFQTYLEEVWAEDRDLWGRCLDDDAPDAIQEWMADMDFSERVTHFNNFLS